jgi:hypothetical protein
MMVPFRYLEFWDVPRLILVRYRDKLFLLGSYFDDALDDYAEDYIIEIVPPWVEQRIAESSLTVLEEIERQAIGTVPVKDVVFDETRRKFLDPSFLDRFFLTAG